MKTRLKLPDKKVMESILKVLAALIAAVLGVLGGQSMVHQGHF